jgi:hypothetical protein
MTNRSHASPGGTAQALLMVQLGRSAAVSRDRTSVIELGLQRNRPYFLKSVDFFTGVVYPVLGILK